MSEKHSSGTSMWAWRTALGVVPTNAFEKDVKACAVELDAAFLRGLIAGIDLAKAVVNDVEPKDFLSHGN